MDFRPREDGAYLAEIRHRLPAGDRLWVDRQESSRDVLVKRDRLPAWGQNQFSGAKAPRVSWSSTGYRLANNRSFTDRILNNTRVGWGSNDSSRLDPVSRKIHFGGRQKAKTDRNSMRTRQPLKCPCNLTAIETSSNPPISRSHPRGYHILPTGRDYSQPGFLHGCPYHRPC